MANEQNLIPFKDANSPHRITGGGKGVPHSKTRLKRLLILTNKLENPFNKEVEGFSVVEQMDLAQIKKAVDGDTKAYETIIDRLEGKPQQSVTNLNVDVEQDETKSPEERLKEVLDRIKRLQEA